MNKCIKFALIAGVCFGTQGALGSYSEEVERSFPIRDRMPLEVDNRWGPITVAGWAGEQVRIRLVKKIEAASEVEAGEWLRRFQIHFEKMPKAKGAEEILRLQVQLGQQGTLAERLKWQKEFKGEVELQIRAPYRLLARLSTRSGSIQVKGWRGDLWARTESASIRIEDQSSGVVSIETLSGSIDMTGVHTRVAAWSQSGKISLLNSEVDRSRLETESGAIRVWKVVGDLQATTQSGVFDSDHTQGRIEVRSQLAPIRVSSHRGSIQAISKDGLVHVEVERTSSADSVDLISDRGSIELQAPEDASARIQAVSTQGSVQVAYPVVPPELATRFLKARSESTDARQVRGVIGAGASEWRLETRLGSIRVSTHTQ